MVILMAFFRRGGIAGAFRNNSQLQQFVLPGVTPTGRLLGTGSYGSVEEVSPSARLATLPLGQSLQVYAFVHIYMRLRFHVQYASMLHVDLAMIFGLPNLPTY